MDALLFILILIYVLSPIPLLVLFLVRNHAASSAKKELAEKNSEISQLNKKIKEHEGTEEQYRQYVCQLQNQLRAKDPDAKIGVLYSDSEEKEESRTTPSAIPAPAAPVQPEPAYVPAQAPVKPSYVSAPLPQPAAPATPTPAPRPTPTRAVLPTQSALPAQTPEAANPVKDKSHTPLILTTGVLLLLLASVGFISATWSMLTIGVRAICLLSFSAIFLGAGIFARLKLKLTNTSIAFYSIGSVALPITIIGSSAFGLLGTSFGFKMFEQITNTMLLSFLSLLILLCFGSAFFRSRVFATGSLACASLSILTLVCMFDYPFNLDVFTLSLFGSVMVFLAPIVKKIPETSRFFCYSKVFEIYSIVNIYVMGISALIFSSSSVWCGLFLIMFSAVFLLAGVLRKKTGLLALPSIFLFLIGLVQIIDSDDLLFIIIRLLIASACFLALSYINTLPKPLRYTFFGLGLATLSGSIIPILLLMGLSDTYSFVPLALLVASAFIFLSVQKKHPIFFSGSLIPIFTLLWGLSFRLFVQSSTPTYVSLLWGTIISGAMYFLFCYIPHQKFFTLTGFIITFATFIYMAFGLADCGIHHSNLNYYSNASTFDLFLRSFITFFFILLCLVNANRKDNMNNRDRTLTTTPRTITAMRCIYASVWPFMYMTNISMYNIFNWHAGLFRIINLLILIGICFLNMLFFLFRSGTAGIFATPKDYTDPAKGTRLQTPSRITAFFVSMGIGLFTIGTFCSLNLTTKSTSRVWYVVQHLLPFLIPVMLFLAAFRLERLSRLPSWKNSSSKIFLFWLRLAGLFSCALILPYALEILFDKEGSSYVKIPDFFLSAPFYYALFALIGMVYFVVLYIRHAGNLPVQTTESSGQNTPSPIVRIFGRSLSATQLAFFVWTLAFSGILYMFRFILPSLQGNVLFAIMLGLILISITVLFEKNYRIVSLVSAGLLTIHYLYTINYFLDEAFEPAWAKVLLLQIPVVIFLIATLLRNSSDEEKPVTSSIFFWSALLSQVPVFASVPLLTIRANHVYSAAAYSVADIAHTSNTFDSIARWLPFSVARSHLIFFALPGFLLIELSCILQKKSEKLCHRALALLLFTISCIVWMPILKLPSLSMIFEQAYLIPSTVFMLALPWIFPAMDKSNSSLLRLIYSWIAMGSLALIALCSDDLFCLIFFGVVSVAIMLYGYFTHKKQYLILGTVCTLGMLAYIANRVWGSMAWWIYLFVTGGTLVTIAVRNEMKKRS